MGSQFIGLVLLIMAAAVGIYLATNYSDLLNLKVELPDLAPAISFPAGSVPSPASSQIIGNSTVESKKSVRITSVRNQDNFNRHSEFILSANLSRNESVNITDWTVKSNSGSFRIPKAQEIYSFGGIEGDILLRFGDQVSFYSGRGPKGNFRLNKCLGYIEDLSPFSPPVPKNCPFIKRSEINDLSGQCQDYLLSLRACQNPDANPPVSFDDSACHSFLQKLNYVGCADKYRNNPDFLENNWRVWLGDQINIFDSLHDKVKLLD